MSLPEILQKSDVKVTAQRKLIAKKISEFQVPFSAEDLFHQGLKKTQVDLATIYRTLALFVEKGWLTQLDLGEGRARYWPTQNQTHAHTLLCRSCQRIEILPDCLLEKQHEALIHKGFTQLSHKVQFVGICPDCSSRGAT